jgi:hypothetical protein
MALELFSVFSKEQKRNIAIYILGIMLYKFGLEYFNGAVLITRLILIHAN